MNKNLMLGLLVLAACAAGGYFYINYDDGKMNLEKLELYQAARGWMDRVWYGAVYKGASTPELEDMMTQYIASKNKEGSFGISNKQAEKIAKWQKKNLHIGPLEAGEKWRKENPDKDLDQMFDE